MDVLTPQSGAPQASAARWRADAGRRRLLGAVVALFASAVLSVAVVLTPSENGLGTHTQMSMPECGWITLVDLPCPTCGMTTAFTHAADGNLLASFLTQPLGALLCLATAMAALVGWYVAATGSRVTMMLSRLWGPKSGWILASLLLVSWVYKVLSYKGMV